MVWLRALSLLALAACAGEESLVLVAAPAGAAADGVTVVELRAEVLFRGEALPDGKAVIFRADAPLLFETREAAAAEVTRPSGASEADPKTRGGAAVAYLLAPTDAAGISVEASYTTVNKDVLSDSVRVEFAAPPLVAAGRIPGSDILAVEQYFQFDCDVASIGAFDMPRPELRVPCSVLELRDPAGRYLRHTPVRFFAEAGRIDDSPATEDTARRITYVVPSPPTRWPADVRPFDGEGWVRFGDGLIPAAVEQNPRDGLVTLLAVVRGQEALADGNGNGAWDPGELFIDEGEPFLDVDDDGVYTPGTDEACCDSNGNGAVDGPNGRWDAGVWIGRDTRILWTGPIDVTAGRSGVEPSSFAIPAQSGKDFVLTVVDGNGNPPAALGSSDRITVTLDANGRLDFASPPSFVIYRGTGFGRADAYPMRLFGEVEPAIGAVLNDGVRQFSFRLQDVRSPSTVCLASSWTLEADVAYTLGASYSGVSFAAERATLTAAGTLQAQDPCPP